MTEEVTQLPRPLILTWLLAVKTPTQSPANTRKRRRSEEPQTPIPVKRSIHDRSLCGVEGVAVAGAGDLRSQLPLQETSGNMATPIKASNLGFGISLPHTPKSSEKSSTSSAQPSTPSQFSLSSTRHPDISLPYTNHNVRMTLAQNGMPIDHPVFETKYSSFEEEVQKLLGGARNSAMKTSSAKGITRFIKGNYTLPEEDIMWQLLPMIAPMTHSTNEKDSQGAWIVAHFSEDGAVVTKNRQFVKDLLPSWNSAREATDWSCLCKQMAKERGMTHPKPDFTYGIRENHHPTINTKTFSPYTRALMGVAPFILHPYLIVETKTVNTSLIEAENQAIRGGATLVHARRLLNARSGKVDDLGVDKDSYVFSMTMDTSTAKIWVNWCEIDEWEPNNDGKKELFETYHMNELFKADLEDPAKLKLLRAKMHNIIDWGCGARMGEIREVMDRIYAVEQAEQADARIAGQAAAVEGESPTKRLKRKGAGV